MRWLKRDGFHAVSQQQAFAALEHGAKLPAHPIMITFDDGYRDVGQRAAGPHAAAHARDRVRDHEPDLEQRSDASSPGDSSRRSNGAASTIGSHTVTHADLTTLSDADALASSASRVAARAALDQPVQWFAYPAGAHDERIVELDGARATSSR